MFTNKMLLRFFVFTFQTKHRNMLGHCSCNSSRGRESDQQSVILVTGMLIAILLVTLS